MKRLPLPDAIYLNKRLDYNPISGVFTWNERLGVNLDSWGRDHTPKWNTQFANTVAGANRRKYIQIRIDGRAYHAHRLAWMMTFSEDPSEEIDHIDGDGFNNAIKNPKI